MPILANRLTAQAMSVEFDDASIRVVAGGRPRNFGPPRVVPALARCIHERRANWRLIGRGEGIHWPDIDEDVSVNALLGFPT